MYAEVFTSWRGELKPPYKKNYGRGEVGEEREGEVEEGEGSGRGERVEEGKFHPALQEF